MRKSLYFLLLALVLVACSSVGVHKSLDTQAFQETLKQEGVQLVDVRTPEEYEEGHIANALLINVKDSTFVAEAKKSLDKSKPVAVYCRSGKRSKKASDILVENGYSVYELSEGMNGWLKADLPVEK